MKQKIIRWLFLKLFCARWIVSESEDRGELGLRIMGVNLWLYKWPDPMVCDGSRAWRFAEKREFGEVVRSIRS